MLSGSQRKHLQEATDYLAGRGIPPEVADTFRLGSVVEPVTGHDMFTGMLTIPYDTPNGVVYIKFRTIGTDKKYLADGETRLFNVNALHRAGGTVVVCEGELDTIIMDAVVGVPAVGVPGVQAWKKHYPRIFEGFERVLVFADNDSKEDGSNPGLEMGKRISREVPQAAIVRLPAGMDVTDTFLSEGAEFLLDLVER
jgi:DNA primase